MILLLACAEPVERAPTEAPVVVELEDDALTDLATQAVEQTPDWLADDLWLQFAQLDPVVQDELAILLVDLDEVWLYDEVAFTIAHTSPEDLTHNGFTPELLVENARWVYDLEPMLDYVTLVEHGEYGDADHYTTTAYVVNDAEGNVYDVEIDPETYYWYVVHPSIEDESPWYVKPWAECKKSSLECASDPESGGTFWRSFLWEGARDTCPDEGACPVLDEVLPGLEVAWTSGAYGDEAGAISQIARFMLLSDEEYGRWLNFGAQGERSIQPNRIYGLGRGNCGEWADMTTALTRTALIPNYNVAPASWDHTWNEFYDANEDRWVAWEPVNFWLDHGYGAPYNNHATRGDGKVFNVTDQYIDDTFTMELVVSDQDGLPVEGATVLLATPWGESLSYGGEAYTDIEGRASFEVRSDAQYYYRVDHAILGGYPDSGVTAGPSGIATGESDLTEVTLNASRPAYPLVTVEPLEVAKPSATLRVTGASESTRVYASSYRYGEQFSDADAAVPIRWFLTDEDGYALWLEGNDLVAFAGGELGEAVEVDLAFSRSWRLVFVNEATTVAAAVGDVAIVLQPTEGARWEGSVEQARRLRLLPGEHHAMAIDK